MYCLFMYTQRPYWHEKTIITETLAEMIKEINNDILCCTIKCHKQEIMEKLNHLTNQTINHPIHWTDKYHGFCLFLHSNII